MIKEKEILVRVGETLKLKAKEKAQDMGISMSGYVRMLINADLKK